MEENNINGNSPTERQLVVIRKLARFTKASVNLNNIKTKQDASRLIEDLIAKQNGNNGNGNGSSDCKEKKIAFGLATKLVFCKYKEQKMDYILSHAFWGEVEAFYQQYVEHQDRAVKPGSQV